MSPNLTIHQEPDTVAGFVNMLKPNVFMTQYKRWCHKCMLWAYMATVPLRRAAACHRVSSAVHVLSMPWARPSA